MVLHGAGGRSETTCSYNIKTQRTEYCKQSYQTTSAAILQKVYKWNANWHCAAEFLQNYTPEAPASSALSQTYSASKCLQTQAPDHRCVFPITLFVLRCIFEPCNALRLEAIAITIGLEAIALKLEAIPIRFEAIAIRFGGLALSLQGILVLR